jgi:outer membrane protein insertion porin family
MRTFLYNSVFITILAFFVSATDLFADDHLISRIDVTGNNRIDGDTILNYSKLSVGSAYNQAEVDEALRDLYKTELFSDVQINYDDSRIVITVQENFLINQVAFEGNKAINDDSLRDLVSLKARSTFSKNKLEEDISTIISSYRSAGRYSVVVEPKIIKLDFNRIDLVYEINEGSITKITDINFIGNQNYSDRVLRSVISTSRSTWIDKIWGTGRSYDNAIMEYDKELLAQFYRDNGYINFSVVNAIGELNNSSGNFVITFTVDEGDRYHFGDVSILNQLDDTYTSLVAGLITTNADNYYDESEINLNKTDLVDFMKANGLPFATVDVIEEINENTKKVNLTYVLENGPPMYVERIEISGNQRTYDYVIRRELKISEGDALNQTYLNQSMRNLRGLNFFSDVKLNTLNGSAPDKKVIQIAVTEKPTGSLMFGAGYSSVAGFVGSIYVNEDNLLGKGQKVATQLTLGGNQNLVNIQFTEPSFMSSYVSAGIDIFGNETDLSENSGYKDKEIGAGLRFGFPLSDDLNLVTKYKYTNNEVYDVPANASTALTQLEGKRDISEFGYALRYNTLDNMIWPTSGTLVDFSQDFAGLGGDVKYLRTEVSGNYYMDLTSSLVGSISLNMGHIFGLDDQDVLISDAFHDPGTNIRGFAQSGISPRLTSNESSDEEAIGGNTYISTSAELTFPFGSLTEEYGVKGGVHLNAGSLFDSDLDPSDINDSDSLRTSVGASIFWESPIGPLRFDFTEAINKETFDKTEFFQFSGGTNF